MSAHSSVTTRDDWGALGWVDAEVTDEVDVVLGDSRDIESVARAQRADYVCHLAAQVTIPYSYLNPRDFIATNVEGSLNVPQLRSTQESGMWSTPRQARSTAVRSSYRSTRITRFILSRRAPPARSAPMWSPTIAPTTCPSPSCAGPTHSAHGSEPLRSFRRSSPRRLPVARSGSARCHLGATCVEDTAEGYLAALSTPDTIGRTLQSGRGVDIRVGEIVDLVAKLTGHPLDVEEHADRIRPDRSQVTRLRSSPQRAQDTMGWTPRVDLREGLHQTMRCIEGHAERYRTDQYVI